MGLSRTSTITFYLILEQSSARNIFYKLEHVIVKFLLAFFEWTNSYMIDFVMCKHVQTIFLGWDRNTFGLAHSESSVCKLMYLFVIVLGFSPSIFLFFLIFQRGFLFFNILFYNFYYIYIYIYVCVCVCLCVCARLLGFLLWLSSQY